MNNDFNRLQHETSPYLLQHASNPVHWEPWGATALARAVREDKPILLSIGYSACHWCHVMAHESFEDTETAKLMNRLYVNIKVDREERPDLDRIYQLAHHVLTRRRGGWPLTVMLTPNGQAPIFAGTYFPREPRHGMPSFRQVLVQVEAHYRGHRDKMDDHDNAIRQHLASIEASPREPVGVGEPLRHGARALLDAMDPELGGFGRAPKFPHATALEFLLDRLAPDAGDVADAPEKDDTGDLRRALTTTLDAMARGGMYDQLGGGFFRYSVDDHWSIPHFEKMLYDNALLMPLYARAGVQFDNERWRQVARETAEWAIRDMQLEDGAFCASLDADSEGEEGRFYVFTENEFDNALEAGSRPLARRVFGIDEAANFEGRHHLQRRHSPRDAGKTLELDAIEAEAHIEEARLALLRHRATRVAPERDDKCLTAWNALMIKALARTGRLLRREDFIDSATRALGFLRSHHTNGARLFATSRHRRAHLDAYLDDYAFLADAILELLQCRWRADDFHWCLSIADHVLEHFTDRARGGLYFTSDDHERLLHRPLSGADESIPSGNGVACRVFRELGRLTGNSRYLDAAQAIIDDFHASMTQFPAAHGALLGAWQQILHGPVQVLIAGDAETTRDWGTRLAEEFRGGVRFYPIADQPAPTLPPLAGAGVLAATTAWVCGDTHCLPPVESYGELQNTLIAATKRVE